MTKTGRSKKTVSEEENLVAELDQFFMALEEGKALEHPVRDRDIGGELLSILSHGLYTNPLDAIREYVQNAVDAQATEVMIQITGNSVWILDDGAGMSPGQLHEARGFGVSSKPIADNVGFRGIGIYSGFDLCNRLLVTSKQSGEGPAYILEFDFGQMKRLLEDSRSNPERPVVPLQTILSDHTHFRVDHSFAQDDPFTLVQLEDISDVHIGELSNRDQLRDYVLRNLPIDFDDEFEHRDQINPQLRRYVKGYNPIRVILQSDTEPDEVIVKPSIPDLDPPVMHLVRNSDGEAVAFVWACLTKGSKRIGSVHPEHSSSEGLVYKVKGFTIGDRGKLKALWGGKQVLYSWYTGEVYVVDERVIPNAERDDFETNAAKRELEVALQRIITEDDRSLYNIAKENQEERVAERKINEFSEQVSGYESRIAQPTCDHLAIYAELARISRSIGRYKRQATDEYAEKADELMQKITSLRATLRAMGGQDATATEEREGEEETTEATCAGPLPTAGRTDKSEEEQQAAESEIESTASETPMLLALLADVGMEPDESSLAVFQVIQDALEAVLGQESQPYRDLLADIEERLMEASEE